MSRAPLGRGLAALIPSDILDSPRSQQEQGIIMAPLDKIRPNPENPRIRFSETALNQLAESIRNHGVITPLLVRRSSSGDGFILVAGERRLRASGLAGLEEVPVWVRDDISSLVQLELALIENIQREDLDPIETAEAYRRLVEEFGMTQAAVARRVGKDRATVANAIRLLRLPESALIELRNGGISAGHGKALLALPDDDQLIAALKQVLEKDLSVRATERLVSSLLDPATRRRRRNRGVPLVYQRLGDELSRELGTRVKVEPKGRGQRGKIVIEYFSPEDLDRLVSALSQD
jgi:ParB family chromosome partitioning protein